MPGWALQVFRRPILQILQPIWILHPLHPCKTDLTSETTFSYVNAACRRVRSCRRRVKKCVDEFEAIDIKQKRHVDDFEAVDVKQKQRVDNFETLDIRQKTACRQVPSTSGKKTACRRVRSHRHQEKTACRRLRSSRHQAKTACRQFRSRRHASKKRSVDEPEAADDKQTRCVDFKAVDITQKRRVDDSGSTTSQPSTLNKRRRVDKFEGVDSRQKLASHAAFVHQDGDRK